MKASEASNRSLFVARRIRLRPAGGCSSVEGRQSWMSRIRLHFDADAMQWAVAQGLRARGVDTITDHEAGMAGATDEEHLEFARDHGRVLSSFNVSDFFRGGLTTEGCGTSSSFPPTKHDAPSTTNQAGPPHLVSTFAQSQLIARGRVITMGVESRIRRFWTILHRLEERTMDVAGVREALHTQPFAPFVIRLAVRCSLLPARA